MPDHMALASNMKQTMIIRDAFFFREFASPLYGCLHSPKDKVPHCGVLICYPFEAEYLRAHRCFVQLADRLAKTGMSVLRFDYTATGDSMGEDGSGTIKQWSMDICDAARELRRRSEVSQIAIVGLRLGATLAANMALQLDAKAFVLWNPIINGHYYHDELLYLQRQMLRDIHVTNIKKREGVDEVLGAKISQSLCNDITSLNLFEIPDWSRYPTLILDTNGQTPLDDIKAAYHSQNAQIEYRSIPADDIWLLGVEQTLVPHHVLSEMATWLTKKMM